MHAKYFDVNPKLILVIQHKPLIILQYPNHFFPCKYSFFEEYKRAVKFFQMTILVPITQLGTFIIRLKVFLVEMRVLSI